MTDAQERRSTMTDEHKEALAAGRASSLAVRRYLDALESNKPRRGRRTTRDSVTAKLADVEAKVSAASALQRLHLMQERKELKAHLSDLGERHIDVEALEAAFINVALEYGSRKGISYTAWRESGVSADVLRRAGIRRTTA